MACLWSILNCLTCSQRFDRESLKRHEINNLKLLGCPSEWKSFEMQKWIGFNIRFFSVKTVYSGIPDCQSIPFYQIAGCIYIWHGITCYPSWYFLCSWGPWWIYYWDSRKGSMPGRGRIGEKCNWSRKTSDD